MSEWPLEYMRLRRSKDMILSKDNDKSMNDARNEAQKRQQDVDQQRAATASNNENGNWRKYQGKDYGQYLLKGGKRIK